MAKAYPETRATRRPLVERECQACGKAFMAKPSNVEVGSAKACSKECSYKVRKTRSDKKPRKSYVCKWCGKVFQEDKARSKPMLFCSNRCLGLSKRKNGKEHPRRKQAVELQRWTREVILRDKKCVRCGVRETLQAHHVKSYAKNPELRLDINNGVALCPPCHHAQHPKHSLEWYLNRGGQAVQRCVICESPYVPRKKSQRSCSISCGRKARYSTTNGDRCNGTGRT